MDYDVDEPKIMDILKAYFDRHATEKELAAKNEYRDKTILVATHGFALRAMLNFLYEDKNDYWHDHVPYNCAVNIIEAHEGECKLIADDKIYYKKLCFLYRLPCNLLRLLAQPQYNYLHWRVGNSSSQITSKLAFASDKLYFRNFVPTAMFLCHIAPCYRKEI